LQQSGTTEAPYAPGFFQKLGFPGINDRFLITAVLILAALYVANLYSFLLFHVIVETFSVIVAFAIFMFTWNTRTKIDNSCLLLLGAAYLSIGAIDLLHTISYKGMGVFKTYSADTATQLWISARYIESFSLAAAPLFVNRKIPMPRAISFYMALFILVVITVFIWPVFPVCYIDGKGLTPFKKISEYFIALLLVGSLVILTRQKAHFDEMIFSMLRISILLTIAAELMFTLYISVYGISNLVGHFLKLISIWFIYKAIIETGFRQPYALLFRELAHSEERYRNLVDTLPTGICEITPDLHITYVNPAGLKIIGYEEEDIRRGINLNRILNYKEYKKVETRANELSQGRPIDNAEYQLIRKDGTKKDVIVKSAPIHSDDELQSIQATLTDVTELNQLKSSFQQARKMEAVSILAGGMAHKINNMLMGLMGRIELIKLQTLEKKVSASDFADLLASCDRIAGLIKQLLAYSRGGRYQTKDIVLPEFIREVLAEFEGRQNLKFRLFYDFPANIPRISADSAQLQMLISEIVKNATEAIDKAGQIDIHLQIEQIDTIQARQWPGMQPGKYVCLKVRDTGDGMNAETLTHVFEPFYTTKESGRGLGMAAVYGIVKNHGGWVGVDSKPGIGTSVRIYFPVDRGNIENK
jgi:PAS domain S-box-containing protein